MVERSSCEAIDVTAPRALPRVSVLGPLTITGARQSRRGLRATAVELIAYLALRPAGSSRDELLEALWPGDDPARSRPKLYQATRDARRMLGSAAINNAHDRYLLDRAHAHVDFDDLEKLLSELDRATGAARKQLLGQASALFGGEPLAGSDFHWAEGELRRLRTIYVDLLLELCRARLEGGEPRSALDAVERAITLDPLNEELWRTALEAEATLGMRAAVDDRYRALRDLLMDRLGVRPELETRTLYHELLAQT
jgi:DNA-binding SARP family transcriptional activator